MNIAKIFQMKISHPAEPPITVIRLNLIYIESQLPQIDHMHFNRKPFEYAENKVMCILVIDNPLSLQDRKQCTLKLLWCTGCQ